MEPVFRFLKDDVGVGFEDGVGDFQPAAGGKAVEYQTVGGCLF